MIKLSYSCPEDLNSATRTDRGQFCGACQIDVYDFRGKSSAEIKEILDNNSSIRCGTFDSSQAEQDVVTKVNWFFRLAFAAVFILGLGVNTVFGQSDCKTGENIVVTEIVQYNSIQIKGTIFGDDKMPISNVTIWYESSDEEAMVISDKNGNFTLDLSDECHGQEIIIYFSHHSYKEKTLTIESLEVKQYIVKVKLDDRKEYFTGGIIARP